MPITRCPECGAQVRVEDQDLGYDVECPTCRGVFKARAGGDDAPPRRRDDAPDDPFAVRDDPADRPSRRRRPADDEDDDDYDDRPRRRGRRRRYDDLDDEEVVEEARRAVYLPALFSILACVLTAIYHVFDMLVVLANPAILQNNPLLGGNQGGGGFQWTPESYAAVRLFSISWQVVTLIGSVQMMRLRSRGFAFTAMALQIIPCGAGVCCILGLPIGIWGLVTLNRPDVKDGFDLAAKGVQARAPDDDYDDDGR